MFSENEVMLTIICVLTLYIGMNILWKRLLDSAENSFFYFSTKFEIKKADRVFSVSEDVIKEGIWCQIVFSLWRCRKTKDFYVSRTYEYNNDKPLQEFIYVDKFRAKELIQKCAPKDQVAALLTDWIERTNRLL